MLLDGAGAIKYYTYEHMSVYSYLERTLMRKVYKLEGDLCANCAGKIQHAAEKLDGVNKISVNAMTYKLTIDAQDDKFDTVLQQTIKLFDDIEPDCEVLV